MKPPVFSIITVTYNASQWLERTILSILSQSYPHIEYIVIDGNSTDGTVELIKQYASGISYWQSEPDKGLYDAMNKGLLRATGDYVWFINAGDTLYTADTLQEIVTSLKKKVSLPDVMYGDTMIVDAQGAPIGLRRLRPPKRLTWKSFRKGMLVNHQSFIAKKEIAPLYNTTYRLVADYDWCIQCLQRAQSVHNTFRVLSNFLEAGMSSVERKASLKERYKVMCHYYGPLSTFFMHGWFAVRFYTAKWFKGRV
ncbi:glycosyltransferase [Parabacteroides sp. 52]|uniref:glycosyltransferase family 2 protein n=1 Tax=unclassified Parabacteroides TaxID=2649774 RepID=UPI0013D05C2F|nr:MULTISPECIES: glycosyltransferase family 2 protein [unclassified Parabacteroides]NDV55378.1 glycosyltransferase [Parabacteroides sp. 52]